MIGIETRVEIMRTLNALEKFESDLTPIALYKLVGQRLLKWVNDNFKAEGLEVKWPALSPNTIASRRAGSIKNSQGAVKYRGRRVVGSAGGLSGAKPLQDTGRLKQSFFADSFYDRLIVGTQNAVAEYHHFGTKAFTIRPNVKKMLYFMTAGGPAFAKVVHHPGIPKRPLLPSDAMTQALGEQTIGAEIARAMKLANQNTA